MSLRRMEMCGMIAVWARIIWGANPYPLGGRLRRVTIRAAGPGMFAHARPNDVKARTTARSRRPAGALGVAASIGGRRPIRGFQTKGPRRTSPRGPCSNCDDDIAGDGAIKPSSRGQQTSKFSATASTGRGRFCPALVRNEKARRRFRRGLYEICDDVNMHLICPTRQVPKQQIQTGAATASKRSPRRGRHGHRSAH